MSFVEFYKLNNDGTQKVIAACRFKDGLVACEGDMVFIGNLRDQGVNDYNNPKGDKIFFKDGIKFLEHLKFNFNSGYLNASEVKNDK